MVRTFWFMALCGSVTLALASQAAAGDEASLRAEVDCLKAQIAQIQNSKHETWLNEQRSGQLKALIHEVLADAETRATLLQDGLSAGHDGEHFFLKSADGNNLLQIGGQVQLRGNWDSQDNRADEDEFGLQISRAKLWFSGHAGTPRLTYFVRLAALDASAAGLPLGFSLFEDVKISYELADGLSLSAGHFPLPFLREELTGSENQLAVERSATNEFFTLNRASQIQADLQGDGYRLRGAFSDGANSGFSTAGADAVEIALTGRVDLKIAGDWDQMNDFTAWGGEDFAAFVGAAVHHEEGDADNGAVQDYLGWTVDGSVETGGLGVFAALSGGTIETPGAADRDIWGLVLQAGLNLNDSIEPFIRWETMDDDTGGEPEALTVGFNWFFDGHNSKLTTDLVWVYDGAAPVANPFGAAPFGPNSGVSAFATADNDDLVVVRTQYQLLF